MTAEVYNEEEVAERRRPKLKLLTGGGFTNPPVGENWLIELKKGCVFSCQKKGSTVDLEVYGISYKHEHTVILFNALGTGPVRGVEAKQFSNQYLKIEVIEEGGERLEESQDGNNPQVRPSGMDDDEDASGRQPSDEGT